MAHVFPKQAMSWSIFRTRKNQKKRNKTRKKNGQRVD